MIILYEDNELKFESLGLGVLKDATSCIVNEVLKDTFELEMEYPIFGQLYDEITINRIITAKPDPFTSSQPFRICWISKPLEGIVTIKAYHISYDMNGILVGPISAKSIEALLSALETNTIRPHNFKFKTDIQSLTTYQTTNYYNMRSLLFGSDESILETYKLEIQFDKFNVYLLSKRGSNKGAQIRYGKNMTSLKHEISYENLYNGVYPYYHKESSQTNVSNTSNDFTKVYIVSQKPLQDGWLSFTEGGDPYHPIDSSPVQVATQGEYYNKVFCWDDAKQRYSEKLYDQTTTLIQGAIEPDWIYIDWSGIPNIVVKANKPGYFKMSGDTEYTHHDVGDIVFKGSIRSVMSALIINYSEVIPGTNSNMEDVSNSVSHTDISEGDKIVWVDTELAHSMKYDRIMALDVTSDFKEDEEVNDENLKKKALEYIEKNKIGQYKYSTEVSFVDLSSTTEDTIYTNFDKIQLGDTVRVIHDGLGIDVELRVISTKYNAIEDRYDSIELGEDPETISSNSVQAGDSISSLSNDKGYTTQQEVVSIVAKSITADFIKAVNAQLSKAQIDELTTARIRCTGILEASQVDIDKLVAKLLIADNAEIKNTLTAGEIKVSGDIEIKSGEINIQNEDGTKVFNVDREGNLTANSAKVIGTIEATSGKIGGFTIGDISISSNMQSMSQFSENGVYIGPDGISLGKQLKIFPNGTIASTEVDLLMDPENSIQRKFTRSLESANRSELNDFGYISLGSMTPTEINNDAFQNIKLNDIINISEVGNLDNEDSSLAPTPVKKGDNVIVKLDSNDHLYFEVVSNTVFIESYRYKGDILVSTINDLISAIGTQNNGLEFGDIYRVSENGTITSDSHGSTMSVNEGDYIIYHHQLGYTTDQDWEISIFNYKEVSTDSFFGLTQDGILYANGAFISGDITVKSGEISIMSDDGQTQFKVDRDGNLEANSAKIYGEIHADSGNIGPLNISDTRIYAGSSWMGSAFVVYPNAYIPPTPGQVPSNVTLEAQGIRFNYLSLGSKNLGVFDPQSDYLSIGYSAVYGLYTHRNITHYQPGQQGEEYYVSRIPLEEMPNILTVNISKSTYGVNQKHSSINNVTHPKISVIDTGSMTAGQTSYSEFQNVNGVYCAIPFANNLSSWSTSGHPEVNYNSKLTVSWEWDSTYKVARVRYKAIAAGSYKIMVITY